MSASTAGASAPPGHGRSIVTAATILRGRALDVYRVTSTDHSVMLWTEARDAADAKRRVQARLALDGNPPPLESLRADLEHLGTVGMP